MKIALFVPAWPPGAHANGIVTYASQLVPALRRLGHTVFPITPNKTDDDPETLDLRQFSSMPTIWARAQSRLNRDAVAWKSTASALASAVRYIIQKHRPDVLEIEDSFGWSFAITKLRLVPTVVRLHGPWFLNGNFDGQDLTSVSNKRRLRWEGRGIKSAHLISSPSSEVLRAVKAYYNVSLPHSRTIPNPLDATIDENTWNIKNSGVNSLLFVGRFDQRKGGDLILRAFAQLAKSYPKLTLTFIGPNIGIRSPDQTVLSFQKYIENIMPSAYRSRIEFFGQMDHHHVMALRPKRFITVIASQYEIMPYAVLEAMSFGCPIIASDVGGIPELITHQHNGLLFPSQDVEKLTAACRMLLDNPTFAAQLGRQSWHNCSDLYTSKQIAKQTIQAYQDAIDAFPE
jgi:glycosyltransferase involved in cell wall biosynthesis